MAANTAPIFTLLGQQGSDSSTTIPTSITTATNTYDGTNAATQLIFTADGTNGSYVKKLHVTALGTNTAGVLRIFLNNGSTNGTAGNNALYQEVQLPATTASSTVASAQVIVPMDIALQPGFRIYALVSAGITDGWKVIAVGGDY